MSDEKRYAEREVVVRQRLVYYDAFREAEYCFYGQRYVSNDSRFMDIDELIARIQRLYPLPVCMRGVRVTLSDGSVCWHDGDGYRVQLGGRETSYHDTAALLPIRNPTAEDFRQIARLLDNEQEPVPEETQP